jgi:N-acetyl-gamma-glutamyl-phosphate reductase/acetylglutamate kinase
VASYLRELQQKEQVNIYTDEPGQVLAVVTSDPSDPTQPAVLEKLLASKTAVLNNVPDNLWNTIRKDHNSLTWRVDAKEVEGNLDRSWHFERADGSLRNPKDGSTMFFYGIQDSEQVKQTLDGFNGTKSSKSPTGTRAYSTFGYQQRRGFATAAGQTKKNVGLIGARGYTGKELINIINNHPNLNLTHVSSRELEGKPLAGYTKSDLTHVNLKPEDLKAEEHVDAWVLALPNGVCTPFVHQVEKDVKAGDSKDKVLVDLSADYRFDDTWTYGLPGKKKKSL